MIDVVKLQHHASRALLSYPSLPCDDTAVACIAAFPPCVAWVLLLSQGLMQTVLKSACTPCRVTASKHQQLAMHCLPRVSQQLQLQQPWARKDVVTASICVSSSFCKADSPCCSE
jgi:hypothetical protein